MTPRAEPTMLVRLPGAIAHYLVGSAYVLLSLATHERRARSLCPEERTSGRTAS